MSLDEFRRTLPASAVPIGAVVRLDDTLGTCTGRWAIWTDVTVAKVVNGAPIPGWLTLTDEAGKVWHLGGSERVGVVSLP